MGSRYYDLVGILRDAGCTVAENSITDGWERRARSSGGFSAAPLGCWWHHTASQTSVNNDLSWMIDACEDAPVGNLLLDRTGTFWPIAGGASNCAGKGGPWTFSRGTAPLDQGNTNGFQIECANNGVGEAYPQVQIDAYFRGSNALNLFVGNQPTDVITHNAWAPTRKIDPATSAAVQGAWRPRSTNSSGTWNLDDIKAECARRATEGDDDVTDEDIERIAQRAAQLVWQYPLADYVGRRTDPNASQWSGGLLSGSHYEAWAAHNYPEQIGADGQFTDPGGNDLNVPWGVGWTWKYVSENLDQKLAEIIRRLDAEEEGTR